MTAPADRRRRHAMAELDYITVRGFRSLASIEKLELRPINLLIGANGSGKSNFIGVFSFLHALREGRLQEYVARAGGAERLLHFGSKTTNAIELEISFRDKTNKYRIKLVPTDSDELLPAEELVSFWDKKNFSSPLKEALNRSGKEAGISEDLEGVGKWVADENLRTWRSYHFHDTSRTSPMRKSSNLHDNRFLRPDGSNLPAFLYYLRDRFGLNKEQRLRRYRVIEHAISQVAPFFEDFQLEPNRLNPDKIRLEWRHRSSDAYFDASSLSDGSLRFMALATLFLQPEELRPSVILVDEPELGLHPYAITILASMIKQAATTTQVILSTQSSLLLDHFEPEDVLVAEQKDGATSLSRLDGDGLEEWLEDYSLGQLWEKNELGGRPGGA